MEKLRQAIEQKIMYQKTIEKNILQEKEINFNELLVVSGKINALMECLLLTYQN